MATSAGMIGSNVTFHGERCGDSALEQAYAFTAEFLPTPSTIYAFTKRVFDVMVAGSLLAALLPVMLLVALAVKVSSPGPILYRQRRVGRDAQPFEMLKFRSMRCDVAAPSKVHKSENDPRVTRVGKFIRKTSLDELPQLINILKGEMTLVGPRPELVEMLEYYGPMHYRRHLATPGLTGWWQINGRITRGKQFTPEEDLRLKLRDDLHYLENRSILFDLRILLLTVPVVLASRGAM